MTLTLKWMGTGNAFPVALLLAYLVQGMFPAHIHMTQRALSMLTSNSLKAIPIALPIRTPTLKLSPY
jgi:hypothetical protein